MTLTELKARFRRGEISKPDFIAQALDEHRRLFGYVEVTRDTDVREIRITAEGVAFRMGDEGIWLHAPANEARVAPVETMNFGRYEPHETRVMNLLARGARCILDVGANIGWFAVRFAKRAPGAEVHAFEPIPATYGFLQRNVAANGVGDRVHTYNMGLSESSGTFEFFISPASGTNASLLNVAGSAQAQRVSCVTSTLDEWMAARAAAPDFIKCDVEGAELLVFRGGRETLAARRPVVFAEMLRKWSKPFGYHPNDMLRFFEGLGYAAFAVGADGVRRISEVTEETVETNYAFLHTERHAALASELMALDFNA